MKTLPTLFVVSMGLLAIGCNNAPIPVQHSRACNVENNGKYVEIVGFFYPPEKVFCTNSSGRMMCHIDLEELRPGTGTLRAEIEEGSGANNFEKPAQVYEAAGLHIYDNKRNRVKFSGRIFSEKASYDKIKLTGSIKTGSDGCLLRVTKIEKL